MGWGKHWKRHHRDGGSRKYCGSGGKKIINISLVNYIDYTLTEKQIA